jgi:hypothetical protein
MKLPCIAIILIIITLLMVCKEEGTPRSGAAGAARDLPKSSLDTQAYCDSLLTVLLALQDSVYAKPRDVRLIAALSIAAYDTNAGAFVTAGKATFNPDFPEAARVQARQRASKYVGERWSLYLKAWRTGQHIAFGSPVSGSITYSKQIYSKQKGDTLYELILIPLGSVVLEEQGQGYAEPGIK